MRCDARASQPEGPILFLFHSVVCSVYCGVIVKIKHKYLIRIKNTNKKQTKKQRKKQ